MAVKENLGHTSKIIKPMQDKFEKYWTRMRDFAAIASVFDPHCKLHLVTFMLTKDPNDPQSIEDVKKNLYAWFSDAAFTTSSKASNHNPHQESNSIAPSKSKDKDTADA